MNSTTPTKQCKHVIVNINTNINTNITIKVISIKNLLRVRERRIAFNNYFRNDIPAQWFSYVTYSHTHIYTTSSLKSLFLDTTFLLTQSIALSKTFLSGANSGFVNTEKDLRK